MKNLVKNNLSALSQKMPLIEENMQKNYYGGTYYVSGQTYQEVGVLGYGDDIQVIVNGNFENGPALFTAKPLQDMDIETQKRIFAQYTLIKTGYEGSIIMTSNTSGKAVYFIDGTLYFNMAESEIYTKGGLMYELERLQQQIGSSGNLSGGVSGGVSGGISGTIADPDARLAEIYARLAELDLEIRMARDPQFVRESQNSERKALASDMLLCWRAQGHTGVGYQICDAYRICGVLNN